MIYLEKSLIGEEETTGLEYYIRKRRFITLPENDIYGKDYGFYISGELTDVYEMAGYIRLPDDYKVELQKNPAKRTKGERNKRYKLTGKELKETVLFPYEKEVVERLKKAKEAEDYKNKKIIGDIVVATDFGGRSFLDRGDNGFYKYYFKPKNLQSYHLGNKTKRKERMMVYCVVATDVSKYQYANVFGYFSPTEIAYKYDLFVEYCAQTMLTAQQNIKGRELDEETKILISQVDQYLYSRLVRGWETRLERFERKE